MKKLIYLNLVFLALNSLAHTEPAPDFRLVVTGGLSGVHQGNEAFYDSPLFRLGSSCPVKIENAVFKAYSAKNTLYFSDAPIDLNQLIEAIPEAPVKNFLALDASQLFGVKAAVGELLNFEQNAIRRELGGITSKTQYEAVKIGEHWVYAVDFSLEQSGVYWPSKLDEIKFVNAVSATDSKNQKFYFFPRDFRSTQKTFELVDKLLKNASGIPTRFVDLGNALTGSDHENLSTAIEMSQLLQSRNPAALALGRYDLNILSELPDQTPYIGALAGKNAPPNSKRVRIGQNEVRFLAVGEISDIASGFLGEDLKILTTRQSIERIKYKKNDLVIALSENRDSAAEAIEYPILDMVLSLSKVRGGSLPASDDIDLEGNKTLGVRTVAPLVRISSSDVSEISVWINSPGQIKRILIKRNPIVGSVSTQSSFYTNVLPQKNWQETDFQTLLSNILLNAHPNAELVIIEKRIPTTPIDTGLPMPLAENLIAPQSRGIEITLGGTYVKQILKAISKDQFDLPVTVTNTLEREVSESETYKIVVSEKVLAAISDFIARESLFASSSNPSASLQAALQESNKEAHKILAQLRPRENKSSDSLDDRYQLLKSSPSMFELVRQGILEKTPLEIRPERSVLLFDISELDIGIKGNAVNDNLLQWQDQANAKNSKATFDENRLRDPGYFNLLFNTKIGLYYLMPKLETGLIGSIKYYQNKQDGDKPNQKPQKDSVKIEAEARFPIQAYVSPLTRLTYDTQLWPNSILTNLPEGEWPRRVHDMRLFLGVSKKPRLGYELFRVGALLGYDFSRDTFSQSFGAGFELGGAYRYNWKYFGFKIESNFRKLFPIVNNPDAGRMGIVWLTDASVSVPIIAGFSATAMANLNIGERMDNPWHYGTGFVFGLALSYGNRLKWLI